MSWTLLFTDRYNRRAARFLRRHPELRETYRKTLLLLAADPHHPSLRLHALQGRLRGLHSVSINLSYRITLELLIDGRRLIPVDIGDHDHVYRS
ncbi:MAG: type II toxin-antitoxin system YafQ family toxin [Vulcanococcus sp.]